jgi:hypothetical protein
LIITILLDLDKFFPKTNWKVVGGFRVGETSLKYWDSTQEVAENAALICLTFSVFPFQSRFSTVRYFHGAGA